MVLGWHLCVPKPMWWPSLAREVARGVTPPSRRLFSLNTVAQLWYFVKCIYFSLSAYQIRCGYPTRILGNFLTKKYNHLNLFLFQGYGTGPCGPLGAWRVLYQPPLPVSPPGFASCPSWWSCGPSWTGSGQTPRCPSPTGCAWRTSTPTSSSSSAAVRQRRYSPAVLGRVPQ